MRREARSASRLLLVAGAAVAVTACGTPPAKHRSPSQPPSSPSQPPSAEAPPKPSADAPRKPGGYYLDDGPHADPPAGLDRVPDALPKVEPIRRANTRPYTAMGRTYVPMAALGPYRATGLASWYGKRYHGKPTASGETYDMYAMTAAHPTLPIPSYARVTSLATQRSVTVRINDRGPFHSDRLIDLSYAAAYKLDILAGGSALVLVESIVPGAGPTTQAASQGSAGSARGAGNAPPGPPGADQRAGVYVQLGAFGLRENAATLLARLQSEAWLAGRAAIYESGGLYRVQAGPYRSRGDAQEVAARAERALDLNAVVVGP